MADFGSPISWGTAMIRGHHYRTASPVPQRIGYLQIAILRYKNIVRFHVSVCHLPAMKNCKSVRNSGSHSMQLTIRQSSGVLRNRTTWDVGHHIIGLFGLQIVMQNVHYALQAVSQDPDLAGKGSSRMCIAEFSKPFENDLFSRVAPDANKQITVSA